MAISVPYWVSQAVSETGRSWCTQIRPPYGVAATGWMSDLNGRAQAITVYIHVVQYQNESPYRPGHWTGNSHSYKSDGWYVDVEASNVGAGRGCSCYLERVSGSRSSIAEGSLSATGDGNGYVSRRRLGRIICEDNWHETSNSDYGEKGYMTFRIRVRSNDGRDYYSGNYYVTA